ncbi:hypothetical protein PUN4_600150 [Paraburkholderia unamae]|nr:hypothetical protein PUN4_600150 [Paraburkholderia unamae]
MPGALVPNSVNSRNHVRHPGFISTNFFRPRLAGGRIANGKFARRRALARQRGVSSELRRHARVHGRP